MIHEIDDLRIAQLRPLIPPAILMEELPATEQASEVVAGARADATRIIRGQDDRLLIIAGPCSIHDPDAALEYSDHLLAARNRHEADLARTLAAARNHHTISSAASSSALPVIRVRIEVIEVSCGR